MAEDFGRAAASVAREVRMARRTSTGSSVASSPSVSEMIFTTVWFFSRPFFLRLGFGEEISNSIRPFPSSFDDEFVETVYGGSHCLVLLRDGTIWSFGRNTDGALGRDTISRGASDDQSWMPAEVNLPKDAAKAIQVAATEGASFALTEDGSVFGWGTFKKEDRMWGFSPNVQKQYTPVAIYKPSARRSPVVKLCAGNNHMIAILKNGSVLSWGEGSRGQLGRIGLRHSAREDVKKVNMLKPREIQGFKKIKFVDAFCGEAGAFLKAANGDMYAFGINVHGQLAIEPKEAINNAATTVTLEEQIESRNAFLTPTLVESFKEAGIAHVAVGARHGLGLTANGKVYSWGSSANGVLGREDVLSTMDQNTYHPKPGPVTSLKRKITTIQAGRDVSGCLEGDGGEYVWGKCNNAGNGFTKKGTFLVPKRVRINIPPKLVMLCKVAVGNSYASLRDE